MTTRIKQLPQVIANQIAAGEVIERPASVVKELLENALDAKATQISIEIGFGGLNCIKMSDNGEGIVSEDLPLAIAAHATSKIGALKDLYAINSMGFRGEALASIASISRFSIRSKALGQKDAMCLSTEGGNAIQLSPCARSQGTTIEVRDLFFNVPVRKRFLKSERSEFLAIEMLVKRFALSAPEIAIQLNHNGKVHLNLPPVTCEKTRTARIRKLLGKAFLAEAYFLEVEHAGLHLKGWVSTPEYQLSQSDKQWIYVNQRMVRDKLLSHAVKQAYEGLLYAGRHPVCLLYLTINPAEVDVNVHPTKHEVRFQQPRLVHDFIRSQLLHVLHHHQKEIPYPVECKRPLPAICAPYVPAPLSPAQRETTSNWFPLNARFMIYFSEGNPHLVDALALQKRWLLTTLKKEPLPLQSRPLFVPLQYPVSLEKANAFKALLSQIGIETDLAGQNTVLIRSLPSLIPHLQITPLLASIFEASPCSLETLLEKLPLFQSFDLYSAKTEEIEVLIHSLQDNTPNTGCKLLSLKLCEDLVYA
ncbi:MAG: DNA mismatch repair endonuclease MutL [Tatlockia sp.]|jgi:DNA mismatch repair protein MutL